MIPDGAVTQWAAGAPWPTRTQVEQDLLLSRLICEIANHAYLGDELVFRGGTCFHKLHIHPARRYSEDLDYVRSTAGGIKEFTQAMTGIGTELGFEVMIKVGVNPKVSALPAQEEPGRVRHVVGAHRTRPHRRRLARRLRALSSAVLDREDSRRQPAGQAL
ncbi:MAG: nucleotidyl transferase AbiEii/AbiGii toxin family protein [Acidimicrobiales bacterium]